MKITRLHLLLGLICAGIFYGWWHLRNQNTPTPTPIPTPTSTSTPTPTPTPAPVASAPVNTQDIDTLIKSITERYSPLEKQFGKNDDVSTPFEQAKTSLESKQLDAALLFAKRAMDALTHYEETLRQRTDLYEVKEGDTLWQIAADHSPVRRGAAWVVIWRANEKVIADFDHVPGGLFLKIPQKKSEYRTRYWKAS